MKNTPNTPQVGKLNVLRAVHDSDYGMYLDGGDLGEILLPTRYVPDDCAVDDQLEVFIYHDSQDRLVAVTARPFAQVGDFAHLQVVSMSNVGAFLDWGLAKDLFLPFREQTRELRVGHDVIVFIYLDKSGRISASMRVEKYLKKNTEIYKEGQEVDLFIIGKTDLGYKAIINGEHLGVLFQNEVFQELNYGEKTKGLIKKVRPDGKVDLSLYKTGHKAAASTEEKILELLQARDGFLPFTDKTSPEIIYETFGVSKKKYKIALGGLYKQRKILVEDGGLRLLINAESKKV